MATATTAPKEVLALLTNIPEGLVGERIYEAVEYLTEHDDTVTQNQAIKIIAEATGRTPGTVSANYYRVKRTHMTDHPSLPPGESADIFRSAVNAVKDGLATIAAYYEHMLKENGDLRAESEKFKRARELLL